ncbi:MAG: hypothetical protein ACYC0V_04270 [Armatimonadota bacterium]
MQTIWTQNGLFKREKYKTETELENVINLVKNDLFGKNRIYLDVKKKIGVKGGIRNIPDGYLIDLSSKTPRLFMIEVELAAHDPLRHIAVQILQFSLSFESEKHEVKKILLGALKNDLDAKNTCEKYAHDYGFRNYDHLLDVIVYDGQFSALVIIDEMPDHLENILSKKFQFGVEVIELACFGNPKKEKMYLFEPFLSDMNIGEMPDKSKEKIDTYEIDTIVIPSREDGFLETFLGENRWYAIRINGIMRPQIKYIAVYRIAPISAITHIAPVKSIESWQDSNKYVLNFSEPAEEIGPIKLLSKNKSPQSPRYTSRQRLMQAKTLDDLW